jgi:hypothetical protein
MNLFNAETGATPFQEKKTRPVETKLRWLDLWALSMLYEDPHTHLRPDPFKTSESAVSLEAGLEEQRDLRHWGRDWLPTSTFVVPRGMPWGAYPIANYPFTIV